MEYNELFEDYFDDNIQEDLLLSSENSSPSSSESENEPTKVLNFLETINRYSESDFKSHFRLKRSTVLHLIEMYKNKTGKDDLLGRLPFSAELQIYIYLWYMANSVTFRQLGNLFGVAKSSAWNIVNNVAKFLIQISPNFIKWPRSEREILNAQRGFEKLQGIPRIIAAIDVTHIKIKAPRENAQNYCNRKKFYSIALQVIVDSEKKILDVHCGEPGSLHDAQVLRKSEFFRRVEESIQSFFPSGTYMIGDSAYPCKNWLVPPFRENGSLTDMQKKFNYIHSSTRGVVENSIKLLKTRFRRLLHFTEQSNIPLVVNITYSACVLHNICLMQQDYYSIFAQYDEDTEDDHSPSSASSQEMYSEDRRAALVQELLQTNIL